jgi:hypothetical protein
MHASFKSNPTDAQLSAPFSRPENFVNSVNSVKKKPYPNHEAPKLLRDQSALRGEKIKEFWKNSKK